ncbi:Coiled-coil domain-containing protein 97 [Fusarium oxysporum f. sp. albedinis]|nr:Coiled-coil domain-containing protein 97 [Fusarium oxysporum f. sp. albedinis]
MNGRQQLRYEPDRRHQKLRISYEQSVLELDPKLSLNSLLIQGYSQGILLGVFRLGGILELAVALSWGSPDFKKKLDPGMSGNPGVRPKIHGGVISNSSSDIP